MITLKEHVLKGDVELEGHAWDGADADSGLPNKETGMDWAEHQRIVCAARGLLQGEPPGNSAIKKIFKQLQSAYNDQQSRTVVRVSKGIHQPTDDPHLQLRTVTDFGKGNVSLHKFHLNVSATALPPTDGLDDDRFQWSPVQFSFKHTDGQFYNWPSLVAGSISKKGSLKRRLSISTVQLQAHKDAQAKLKEEAEKALAAETFEKALETFLTTYGGQKKKVQHNNPAKNGDFPSAKFRNGYVNAVVTGPGFRGNTTVHYDKANGVIKVGPFIK